MTHIWGDRRDSNPRQPVPQTGALPTELRSPYVLMACLKRFELLAHALEGRCSIQLSYRHIIGAGNEGRTRDIQLGRLTLYQLSYSRTNFYYVLYFINGRNSKIRTCGPLLPRQVRYRTALYSDSISI